MAESGWIGLADAVRALRAELTAAVDEGQGSPIRFELGTVEMDFLVEVRKEGGGEAGIRFGVISLGVSGSSTLASTHRVKLELRPRDAGGRSLEISDSERPDGGG